jgi:hypothetical protein
MNRIRQNCRHFKRYRSYHAVLNELVPMRPNRTINCLRQVSKPTRGCGAPFPHAQHPRAVSQNIEQQKRNAIVPRAISTKTGMETLASALVFTDPAGGCSRQEKVQPFRCCKKYLDEKIVSDSFLHFFNYC